MEDGNASSGAGSTVEELLLKIMQIERRFASDRSRGAKERQAEIRRLIESAADRLSDGAA